MIAPDMATMLAFVFTDAAMPRRRAAAAARRRAPSARFNCITVDSDTSTSDTLLLFATGKARHTRRSPAPTIRRSTISARALDDAAARSRAPGRARRRGRAEIRRDRRSTGAAIDARGARASASPSPTRRWSRPRSPARTPTGAASSWRSARPASRPTATSSAIAHRRRRGRRDGRRRSPDYDEAPVAAHMKGREIDIDGRRRPRQRPRHGVDLRPDARLHRHQRPTTGAERRAPHRDGAADPAPARAKPTRPTIERYVSRLATWRAAPPTSRTPIPTGGALDMDGAARRDGPAASASSARRDGALIGGIALDRQRRPGGSRAGLLARPAATGARAMPARRRARLLAHAFDAARAARGSRPARSRTTPPRSGCRRSPAWRFDRDASRETDARRAAASTSPTACARIDLRRHGAPPTPVPTLLVAAVALVDADGRVLIAQRPKGKPMAGLWEFPGGKVTEGETPEAALIRELKEELGIDMIATLPRAVHLRLAPLRDFPSADAALCLPQMAGTGAGARARRAQMGAPGAARRLSRCRRPTSRWSRCCGISFEVLLRPGGLRARSAPSPPSSTS